MKLSSKARYGIRALFDIAHHSEGRATQIKEIAERQGIPARFLEQIFQDLKRAGLVGSKRGPRGGYALTRPASEIRIGEIVRALEGAVELADEADLASGADDASREVLEETFRELGDAIEACFDAVNLGDLCDRADPAALRRRPPRRYVYSI